MSKVKVNVKANTLTAFPVTADSKEALTTYGEPMPLIGMKEISVKVNQENIQLTGDDVVLGNISSFEGAEVSMTVNGIDELTRAKLVGAKIHADGTIDDNLNNEVPEYALAWRVGRQDGTWVYLVFLKGTFSYPEGSYKGKEGGTVDPQYQELTFAAQARIYDEKWRYVLDTANETTSQTAVNSFFTKVHEPTTTP